MEIFAKKANPNYKMSTEATSAINNNSQPYNGIVNKLKGYIKLSTNDEESGTSQTDNNNNINKSYFLRCKESIINMFEVEKSYKMFFLVFSVGIGIIFLSLFFISIIVLSPQKFVSIFSLGSIVTLSSFIFLHGTFAYFDKLFAKDRILLTALYIGSICLGLYFALNKSYLFSLIFAACQFITLLVFALSFIPGGRYGISMIYSIVSSPFRSIVSKFVKL
jgi:hypothetical protein